MAPRDGLSDAERLAIIETKLFDIEAMLERRFKAADEDTKAVNSRVSAMTRALYAAAVSLVIAAVTFGLALPHGSLH